MQWLDGLLASRRLGLAFVTAAVPSCIFLALATPPFQTPDAPNHLFRAYQVSRGGLIGKHLPDSASGMIDSGIVAFAGVAVPVAFHHEQKWTRGQATRAADARLTHKEIAVSFVNTAPYPPLNYIPQALAFAVFGHGNVPLLRIYRLACLLNAVCAIMMTAIALRIARRTRPIIFVVALLPMTLSLTASVSQDATLIPLGFLIVAWADFLCSAREFIAPRTAVGLAVLIIAAAIARIPYVAFALLFFHPSLRMARSEGRYGLRRRLIYVGSASCIALGLYLLQTRLAGGVLREGTSMSEQMQYLFSHLSAIPGIAHQTIMTFVGFYFRSFVGALGWLDTYFPDHFYRIAAVAIMLTFIYGLLRRDPADLSRRAWLETGFGIVPFASASALIFFGLYTYWSPIGAPVVEGVQGRYFLPIFPVLGMAVASPVPSWINDGRYVSGARALIAAAILCFPVFNFCAIVQVVLERYYIG
ncbi:hypothetical protein WK52_22775 [Burkholderia multivorans]|nr:hypothetical protein WK52_22775 [Burkholderia multivorans]